MFSVIDPYKVHTPTFLLEQAPEAGVASVCADLFPKDGVESEEGRGYGKEWAFAANNGQVFTVYLRYGNPRIGGNALGPYTAADFQKWLLSLPYPA
jgi:hypothetical protein